MTIVRPQGLQSWAAPYSQHLRPGRRRIAVVTDRNVAKHWRGKGRGIIVELGLASPRRENCIGR